MLRGLPQLTISPTHNSSPNDLTLATSLSLTHTATRSLLASLTLASWGVAGAPPRITIHRFRGWYGSPCLLLLLPHFLFRPSEPESIPVRDASRSWLFRTCSRGLSSFVRPKRSERRSAVDRAFGRARQARSTWTWSERAQVGASVAQKDGSRARGPPLRAGQHRVPEGRPKGGIAVSNMFEPAFASLSLQSLHWLALAL